MPNSKHYQTASEVAQLYTLGVMTYSEAKQRMTALGLSLEEIDTLIAGEHAQARSAPAGTNHTSLETACRALLLAWDANTKDDSLVSLFRERVEPHIEVIRRLIGRPR